MAAKVCGVNKNLYKQYDFKDHIWFKMKRTDLLHLTNRCVLIGGNYWFKQINGNSWVFEKSITNAEKQAINTWLNAKLPSGNLVDAQTIATFFHGSEWIAGATPKDKAIEVKVGSCPHINNRLVIPFGPQFVLYKNQTYLNSWYDDTIDGDMKYLKYGKMVLLMAYGSLCNGTVDMNNMDLEADRVYNMIVTNNYDNLEFRFLINWLAALVQKPGINLQTNIWLLGPIQGLGKGTIIDIMRVILGAEFVGELNQSEVEAGWTDHLVGQQLVEVNEFDTDNKKGWSGPTWGKWIKGNTIEPSLKIRERNVGHYLVLNINNYLFTTNNIDQYCIDKNDRRNQLIRTTDNEEWVQYATAIQTQYFKPKPKEVSAGFAYILEQVKVDLDFISKAFKNEIKISIAENDMNFVDEWYENDSNILKGKWEYASNHYETFKDWFRKFNPSAEIPTLTTWGRKMKQSSHIGVKCNKLRTGLQYIFDTPPVKVDHKLEDSVKKVNKITDEETKITVYDIDIKEVMTEARKPTALESIRAEIRKIPKD